MIPFCLYLLPIAGAIISCSTLIVCSFWIRNDCRKFYGGAIIEEFSKCFINLWHIWNIEKEIESLIERSLENLVATFKEQIPIAGTFLSKAREDSLKERARLELIKLIPSIKQQLLEHLSNHSQEVGINAETALQVKFETEKIINLFWEHIKYSLLIKIALLGFVLGLIQMGFMMVFC